DWVFLDAIPLTPNGKVNRSALPAPDRARSQLEVAYAPPRDDIERALVQIWQEVLGIDQIGIYDNFFDLRGHSLLGTQVVSRVREILQIEMPLRYLFQSPTVAGLAEQIKTDPQLKPAPRKTHIPSIARGADAPVSFSQQRLWFLHELDPSECAYNIPYFIRLKGQLNTSALEKSLAEIIRRHESLRATFGLKDGRLVQVIHEPAPLELPMMSLRHLLPAVRENQAAQLARKEAQQPFDLARGPLLRVMLLELDEDDHALILNMHHII